MRLACASVVLIVALSTVLAGCNEIVGARRYHVGDAGGRDSSIPFDANIDGGTCEPAEREIYYADTDGDGFGLAGSTVEACSQPAGFAAQAGDCNDDVGTANPGATEICDGVDSDCDGTIDEGVIGPIGTPIEVIPVGQAGLPYHVSAAAYDGGFLVVSGRYARWLGVDGMPTGDAFQFTTTSDSGPTAAFVDEGVTPPRGVIAWSDSTAGWVVANAYSANTTTTALGSLQPYIGPTEGGGPGILQVELVPIGDSLALLGLYDSGSDEHVLVGGAINALTWSELGAPFETYVRGIDGALPVEGTNGTLMSVGIVDGLAAGAVLNWMMLDPATGDLTWGTQAADVGTPVNRATFPRTAALPVGTNMVFIHEDSTTVCVRHVMLGNPGDVLTPTACEAAVTWSVGDMAMREGVVGVAGTDGTYQELPFATGTTGTTPVDAGVGTSTRLAVRGGRGIIAYTSASALFVRPLGCQ